MKLYLPCGLLALSASAFAGFPSQTTFLAFECSLALFLSPPAEAYAIPIPEISNLFSHAKRQSATSPDPSGTNATHHDCTPTGSAAFLSDADVNGTCQEHHHHHEHNTTDSAGTSNGTNFDGNGEAANTTEHGGIHDHKCSDSVSAAQASPTSAILTSETGGDDAGNNTTDHHGHHHNHSCTATAGAAHGTAAAADVTLVTDLVERGADGAGY